MSAGPSNRRPRTTVHIAIIAAACLGLTAIGVHAAADGMAYYRTPTEVMTSVQPERGTLRVAGLVVRGTVTETDDYSTLVLSDGATDLLVRYQGRFPDVLREGEGALVEGTVSNGTLTATRILLRHSNEYQAPEFGDL